MLLKKDQQFCFFPKECLANWKHVKIIFNEMTSPFSNRDSADKKSSKKWNRCGNSCKFLIIHSTAFGEVLKIPRLDLPLS